MLGCSCEGKTAITAQQMFGQRRAFEPGPSNKRLDTPDSASDRTRSCISKPGRVPNDCFDKNIRSEQLALVTTAFCLAFGGIHLGAWDFGFPTYYEQVCWRVASALSAFIMLAGFVVTAALERISVTRLWSDDFPRRCDNVGNELGRQCGLSDDIGRVFGIAVNICVWIRYIFTRMYLVVESFSSLRSLPAGSYETVDWSKFVPHFG